jgi:hypothetical protein
MLLFVGLGAPVQAEDAQTQTYVGTWEEWMADLAGAGALVSGGPFVNDGKWVDRDGATDLVLDKVDIGAYALVNTASIDDAIEAARRAPHTALGGSTIVRPLFPR